MTLLPVRRAIEVSTISRNPEDHVRERTGDIRQRARSLDPTLHPFAQAREYTRALAAVKYERIFAKPFVTAFESHRDGVYALSRVRHSLPLVASGAGDGEIRMWHLPSRKCLWHANAHTGIVKSLASDHTGQYMLSCSTDATVKMWRTNHQHEEKRDDGDDDDTGGDDTLVSAANIWLNENGPLHALDCHASEPLFATASSTIQLYDISRTSPIHSFSWGADSINTLAFSPVEHQILASTGSDRSVVLYDVRQRVPVQKIVLLMQTNSLSFSPMDAYYFVTGSEDNNCYTFDLRRLDHACVIHTDHVSAVMSVDYSPTGAEFVSGSYDRTVRLWKANVGSASTVSAGDNAHSREIYHGKRMQRVFDVCYTNDAQFVVSGSDDANVRLWRARASERPGIRTAREKTALAYREKLIERFQQAPEIRHIHKHRHVPKAIHNAKKRKAEMLESDRRKDDRRRKHTAKGTQSFTSIKKRTVRGQIQ